MAAIIPPHVLQEAQAWVREQLQSHDASHDMDHTLRVRNLAVRIGAAEGLDPASLALVELSALLHDVLDEKYGGTSAQRSQCLQGFLEAQGLKGDVIHSVLTIIQRVGFKEELPTEAPPPPAAGSSGGGGGGDAACDPGGACAAAAPAPLSLEAAAVQDADRLDAIGAIGIARCFTFGGAFKRALHDPAVPPRDRLTQQQYRDGAQQATTINHFYEKLLKLKGLMKTATGQRIAAERHAFMETYLTQFHAEWAGEA